MAGGGAVTISATGNIVIDGTISANGLNNSYYGSGGTGGTINLSANAISGAETGQITANGGSGGGYGTGQPSSGGGRIKLESATTITVGGSMLARGGQGAGTEYSGGPGTIFKIAAGQTYGDLIINNGTSTMSSRNYAAAHLNLPGDTGSYQFDSITFSNNGRLCVDLSQTLDVTFGAIVGTTTAGIIKEGTLIAASTWSLDYYLAFKGTTLTDLSTTDLTVTSAGRITHLSNGTTETNKINLSLKSLNVQAGGEINTDNQGYDSGYGPGYGGGNGSSHGGDGGGAAFVGQTYGSFSNPTRIGSGGYACIVAVTNPTGGGGAVIITTIDNMVVDGKISANGLDNNYCGTGGAGGSVNLTANAISGAGTGQITANGGAGGGYSSAYSGSGGGRIKLESATTITVGGTVLAKGGQSGWPYGAIASGSAGTIYKKAAGQTYGDLIIDNGATTPPDPRFQQSAHLNTSADTGAYQFDNLTFANYGRLAVDTDQSLALDYGVITGSKTAGVVNAGTVTTPASWTLNYYYSSKNGTITDLSSKDLIISSLGFLTHYPNDTAETYKLNWSLASLNVQAGGEINTDNEGYDGGHGPGYGNGTSIGSSYGGEGYGASTSSTYGDYSNPVSLGSGGYQDWWQNALTAGGGAVIITTNGSMVVDGNISANGGVNTYIGTGGTGGSVNLVANAISGSGQVAANGGAGGGYASAYPSSGGGRIRIQSATTITLGGSILAEGGQGAGAHPSGAAGTIYKKALATQTNGDLIIDNTGKGVTTAYTPLPAPKTFDSLTIRNYGQFRLDVNTDATQDTLAIPGNIALTSNSIMKLMSDNDGTPAKGAGMAVTAVNISNDVTSKIISNGTGFIHDAGYAGGQGLVAATYGGGGGFGGAGGASSDGGVGGLTYGAPKDVLYDGSGGGATNLGGQAGGQISMIISGILNNAGTISANGNDGTTNGGGGGGGGIQIITNNCTATGTITVNGGSGAAGAGGGGGGRIYIIATGVCSVSPMPVAPGGPGGTGGSPGDPGTVTLESAPDKPTLLTPADSANNVSQNPAFTFFTTDANGDYIRYKFQLATDSAFTQNLSEFVQGSDAPGQTQTLNGLTAVYSGQDAQSSTAYVSATIATLTISGSTPLTENQTYYWRVLATDPTGSTMWSAPADYRSFTVSEIDQIVFTTNVNSVYVNQVSAKMTVEVRNGLNEAVKLTNNQDFTLNAAPTTTDHYYSDAGGGSEITGFTIPAGSSSADFYFKDTMSSLLQQTITVSETHPTTEGTADWTDATQNIMVNATAALDHFTLQTSVTTAIAGLPLSQSILISAFDINNNLKADYTGDVWFTSSDGAAVSVYNSGNHYTFVSGDNGQHTFAGSDFILNTVGNQTITLKNGDGKADVTSGNILVSTPPVEACYDGVQNGSETGVDCGGTCAACPVTPPTPTCSDGVQNGSETGADCGGTCAACKVYKSTIFSPKSGDIYELGDTISVKWTVGSGDDTSLYSNVLKLITRLSISTDGGASYHFVKNLLPPGVSAEDAIYTTNFSGQPYSSYRAIGDSGAPGSYFLYDWQLPTDSSLVGDNIKIKLTPVSYGSDPRVEQSESAKFKIENIGIAESKGLIAIINIIVAAIIALIPFLLALLNLINNLLPFIEPSRLLAFFVKGKDKKHAKSLVYEIDTGLAIPGATILLFRTRDSKLASTAMSGRDGKFALRVPSQEYYYVEVKSPNHRQLMSESSGQINNYGSKYMNNYFGEQFYGEESSHYFDRVVPMKATSSADVRSLLIRKVESLGKILRFLNVPLIIAGFSFSLYAISQSRSWLNILAVSIYLALFIYYFINYLLIGGRSFGLIYEKSNQKPVDLAVVRAVSESSGKLMRTTVSDNKGKFVLALPKDIYNIIVAKTGLGQETTTKSRVRSSFIPKRERIFLSKKELLEGTAEKLNSVSIEAHSDSKMFADSNEIIEKFNEMHK